MQWFKRISSFFAGQPEHLEPKFFKGHYRLFEALSNEYAPYVVNWDMNVDTSGKITGWLVTPVPGDCSQILITPVVEERPVKKHTNVGIYGSDESTLITTVDDLRNSIRGLPGDVRIAFQVVANDESVWYMNGSFTQQPRGCSHAVMTLTHRQLDTLKDLE